MKIQSHGIAMHFFTLYILHTFAYLWIFLHTFAYLCILLHTFAYFCILLHTFACFFILLHSFVFFQFILQTSPYLHVFTHYAAMHKCCVYFYQHPLCQSFLQGYVTFSCQNIQKGVFLSTLFMG